MAIAPRLEIRQGQSLVMTPQLQQAIKLLQLSNLELVDFVEQELSDNPILSREDNGEGTDVARDDSSREQITNEPFESGAGDSELRGIDVATGDDATMINGRELDMDYDNVWNQKDEATVQGTDYSDASIGWTSGGSGGSHDFQEARFGIEHNISQETSLRDYLLAQAHIDLPDPADRLIAVNFVDSLDEAGRVTESIETMTERLGCSAERAERVLGCLQSLDPPGICARDLSECWAIQLRERGRLDPAIETLLQNLELLKQHDYSALAKLCQVDVDDVRDMIDEIWALNHRPAEAFDQVVAQPITPDVFMRPTTNHGWAVELNNDTLPRVLVNHHYYAEVRTAIHTREEKQYLAERLQSANWLVRSLHQRATTILKVAEEIVRQQSAFFMHGVEHLKPLVLRDIAEAIEMHESTVSRVTSNKYMHTPRGLFELKYFFTPAIASSSGGEAHSAESVRHRIKILVEAEAPNAILSDDKMVEILNDEGIDIARRTVAKYRESMRIPSSVQRRRAKAVAV